MPRSIARHVRRRACALVTLAACSIVAPTSVAAAAASPALAMNATSDTDSNALELHVVRLDAAGSKWITIKAGEVVDPNDQLAFTGARVTAFVTGPQGSDCDKVVLRINGHDFADVAPICRHSSIGSDEKKRAHVRFLLSDIDRGKNEQWRRLFRGRALGSHAVTAMFGLKLGAKVDLSPAIGTRRLLSATTSDWHWLAIIILIVSAVAALMLPLNLLPNLKLQQAQVAAWTCLILGGWCALWAINHTPPALHASLLSLMGVSLGVAGLSAFGNNTLRTCRVGAKWSLQEWQFVAWTAATMLWFAVSSLDSLELGAIDQTMVALMGMSGAGSFMPPRKPEKTPNETPNRTQNETPNETPNNGP